MHAVVQFAEIANQFCPWAEGGPLSPLDEAKKAASYAAQLYSLAVTLPDLSDEHEAPAIEHAAWQQVHARFASMPFQYYSQLFDPHNLQDEEPVVGDVADDLADIWKDLRAGLSLYQQGHVPGAVWHWRFHFWHHWGHHAVGALYASHCWLANDAPAAT